MILCATLRFPLRNSAVKQNQAKYYPGRHTRRVHNQLRRSDMLIASRLLQTEQAPEGGNELPPVIGPFFMIFQFVFVLCYLPFSKKGFNFGMN